MGVVNVKLPLRKVGRNHLLATYLIKGIVTSLAYAVSQLRVLRRHKVLIHLKPTNSTPREYHNVWREQTK